MGMLSHLYHGDIFLIDSPGQWLSLPTIPCIQSVVRAVPRQHIAKGWSWQLYSLET